MPAAQYRQPVDPKRAKSAEAANSGIRFKKSKDPAPGSYNVEESIKRSQWPATNAFLITKSKKRDYLDITMRLKSSVPGVGKYKDTEKGLMILSKPPTSLRRLR